MLSFQYPHAYVVEEDSDGVQVWDMVNCVLIRHFMMEQYGLPNISAHDNIITLSEHDYNSQVCSVVLYDAAELLEKKVESAKLWKRNFSFPNISYSDEVYAMTNTTSLIICHGGKISIHNFWKDRMSKSQTFDPPDDSIVCYSEDEDSEDGCFSYIVF